MISFLSRNERFFLVCRDWTVIRFGVCIPLPFTYIYLTCFCSFHGNEKKFQIHLIKFCARLRTRGFSKKVKDLKLPNFLYKSFIISEL